MRAAFVETLLELAERDPRVVLLTADLGYTVLEPFAERYPDRFFNVGVAEQNMVGVATGLAEAGFVPFVYSIASFATLRPYEFVRNGPLVHRLPVRVVGVGGGLAYGTNGISHYALEDVAVMRAQPGLTVVAPADREQARTALLGTHQVEGPIYFRLGKDDPRTVPGLGGRFELGRAQTVVEGDDALVVALGTAAHDAAAAAAELAAAGVSCGAVVVAGVAPAPVDDLAEALARVPIAVTVEAHYVNGGLGSLVAEVIAERGLGCRLVRCAVDSVPTAVPSMHERLTAVFGRLGVDYEIVFVNDGSPDDAAAVLAELAARDPKVVVVNHARAFGSQSAFTSGMRICTGDAVVLLDGDLQDPPQLIEQFVPKWREGYDVVYGVRVKREASPFMRVAFKAFYRLFRSLSYVTIPVDAGDFSLLDRRVVDVINELPETNRFLRGLRAWAGFRQTGVPYLRPERSRTRPST
jgi:transketolase